MTCRRPGSGLILAGLIVTHWTTVAVGVALLVAGGVRGVAGRPPHAGAS